MLVLSRKLGEKIVVPELGLSVAVVGIQGSRVRLGISAPPEVAVHRAELASAIESDGARDPKIDRDPWDALAADLSDAAYQVALRHRPAGSWMSLEIEVAQALAQAVDHWKHEFLPPAAASPLHAQDAAPPRVPR